MDIITFLRSFRIGSFAIFDFTLTYLVVYFAAPYLQKMGVKLSRVQMLWLALPFSLIVHVLFGIETPLTEMVIDPNGYYWVKALVLFMVFMGVRGKRRKR